MSRFLTLLLITLLATPAEATRLFTAGHAGDLASNNQSEWWYQGGGPTQVASVVTGERYGFRVTGLSSGTRMYVGQRISAGMSTNDYFFVFPFHVDARPSAQNTIFTCAATVPTPTEVDARLKSTGEIEIRESGTVIATSSVLALDTTYWIGIRVRRVDGAGNDQMELQLNGIAQGTPNSSLTITSSNACRDFMIGGNLNAEAQTTGDWTFGCVRINEGTGTADTSWPSIDNRCNYLFPEGAGAYSEPTESGAASDWEAVDDSTPDGATTHTSFTGTSANWGASGARLMMALTSAAAAGIGSEDSIHLVAPGWIWASATGATTELIVGIRSGGTDADTTAATTHQKASTTYHFIDDTVNTNAYEHEYLNPVTTSAWTPSELDALEAGARSQDTDDANLTAFWVLVEYDDNAAVATTVPVGSLNLGGAGL